MKIYHLTPSGSLWILDQKEVKSREEGERLFQLKSKIGDVLKIHLPDEIIKIVKLINLPKTKTMSKESMLKKQQEKMQKEQQEKQKEYAEKARKFFEEYTELTDKYGLFIDCKLEYSNDAISPKVVVNVKPPKPVTENKKTEENKEVIAEESANKKEEKEEEVK